MARYDGDVEQLKTAADVARALDVTTWTVTRWIGEGCPVLRREPYLLDLEQVRQWVAARVPRPRRPHATSRSDLAESIG